MTLKEMLIAAGYPVEEMFHWMTDLYVYKNELTTRVIREWCKVNDYIYDIYVQEFNDQVTGRRMYEIYFSWYE